MIGSGRGRSTHSGTRGGLGTRLAVLVAGLAAALLAQPVMANADHTPTPSVVALVGSLQSELGCPGDWQPECPQTRLSPVAGSPDLWQGTFDVPAGAYAYKVALNNAWDENYGAGGAPGGSDIPITAPGGSVTFTYNHATHVISDNAPKAVGAQSGAHWLTKGIIAWDLGDQPQDLTYRLFSAPDGGMTLDDGQIVGGTALPLTYDPDGLPATVRGQFPHLATFGVLRLPTHRTRTIAELLKGQLVVASFDAAGALVDVMGVQTPGVIDQLYAGAQRSQLGLTWRRGVPTVALWAPTARSVKVHVFAAGSGDTTALHSVPLQRARTGVWTVKGDRSWQDKYYLFEVEVYVPETDTVEHNWVTDPYSVGLSTNSERSLLVDLDSRQLRPSGWEALHKPGLPSPEKQSIYELHERDFSIGDATVPAPLRGTYQAFTVSSSNGMKHLRALAAAGLTTVHLLPVNDIATIDERRDQHLTPDCDLESLPPASEQQQECVLAIAGKDGYNWGYDPLHYTTPEGSYATNPEGGARTLEFRNMVAALNKAGLRVVIDVVYNHTPDAGQSGRSNLDRIVPGYYHRLNPQTGSVETSTCCSNTATEHSMMGKLMVDSVLTWAKEYKLDGFRFDLMGHQPKAEMLEIRKQLNKLSLKHDGVDGRAIYLYGEGWNFGEVANDARFEQATQLNMAGTGIGTFTDRLRDAVRGGGPFDANPRIQGFGSGLFTDPNGDPVNGTEAEQRARLLLAQDQIKVGLTGSLKDYTFVDRTGSRVKGSQVDYNGQPAGYTADPQEAITYVEAHDNETLYDALAYKLPQSTSMTDRIRMQTLSLATTALGQGVSFWHAGGEILRSKSLDRNSYDSGDWFNVLDYSYRTNGFARGLPPRPDNQSKWDYMRPLLADANLKPNSRQILTAKQSAEDLLEIRRSSPLFSLGTAHLVEQKLSFPSGGPAQTPGVIVMRIDDTVGPNIDRARKGIVVVFNASDEATVQQVPGAAHAGYTLHPVQANGSDPVVRAASYNASAGQFTVPARTVAVFQR
jgi:pullulanase-type alpha-1,6-glucosidase